MRAGGVETLLALADVMAVDETLIRNRINGMDCADCATDIEKATSAVASVEHVQVSIGAQVMSLHVTDATAAPAVERRVQGLGYQLDQLGRDDAQATSTSHMTSGYRRALWIVVLLNVDYGTIELVGGFLSDA